MKNVTVVIGAGSIRQSIARRVITSSPRNKDAVLLHAVSAKLAD